MGRRDPRADVIGVARLREGARRPMAMTPGVWYPIVAEDQHGLWLDLGGDAPVAIPSAYLDEVRRRG